MNRLIKNPISLLLFAACILLLLPGQASAWNRYRDGCDNCHNTEHGEHRRNVSDQCELCHQANRDAPVILANSEGGLSGPGPSDMGCMGCHGREDSTGTLRGYGLRADHNRRGEGACESCHPGDPAPEPENVLPPYYVRTDVVPRDPCNPNGTEDYGDGNTTGLDNDGDGLYDELDPDCQAAPCEATAAATPLTASFCEGASTTLSDDGSTATCPPGGSIVHEWWEGPAGDPGSTLLATATSYDLPTTLTPGIHEYDLLVYCENDIGCRDTLDTLIQVNVPTMPGAIVGLKAAKVTGTNDVGFSWDLDPDAAFYRVYSVNSTAAFPPRGDNGSDLRCESDGATPCVHVDALLASDPLLFYQVVGDCDDDAAVEGPN